MALAADKKGPWSYDMKKNVKELSVKLIQASEDLKAYLASLTIWRYGNHAARSYFGGGFFLYLYIILSVLVNLFTLFLCIVFY